MNSPGAMFMNGTSNANSGSQAHDVPSSSQGTPIMNLLNVYQEMKADNEQGFEGQIEGHFENESTNAINEANKKSSELHPV